MMKHSWIVIDEAYGFMGCSNCEFTILLIKRTPKEAEYFYCPRCGEKLIEDE